MRIAVSTDHGRVAQHFGRCAEYTLATVANGAVQDKHVIANPGHEPGFLPRFLAQNGVACIIAGGMGERARQLFAERGIKTVVGVSGDVGSVLQDYCSQTLTVGQDQCDH